MTRLVLITGPIGAGKSTVARLLGEAVRDRAHKAAVVDLDDVVMMLRAPVGGQDESWSRSRRVHGVLVAAWLESGVDVVIAHGPIYTADERATLLSAVPDTVPILRVLLDVPFEVAVARVRSDPAPRQRSRDESFLEATHQRFRAVLPTLPGFDVAFDTAVVDADTIAADLAALIFDRT